MGSCDVIQQRLTEKRARKDPLFISYFDLGHVWEPYIQILKNSVRQFDTPQGNELSLKSDSDFPCLAISILGQGQGPLQGQMHCQLRH